MYDNLRFETGPLSGRVWQTKDIGPRNFVMFTVDADGALWSQPLDWDRLFDEHDGAVPADGDAPLLPRVREHFNGDAWICDLDESNTLVEICVEFFRGVFIRSHEPCRYEMHNVKIIRV